MKKFIRTGGGGGDPAPSANMNGHAAAAAAASSVNCTDWSHTPLEEQHSTLSRCREGRLWEDGEFPAGTRALGKRRRLYSHVVWMRPHELCSRPVFRTEGAAGGGRGAVGGELAHSGLSVAVAALGLTPRLLERVVPPGQDFVDNYSGAFRFRFCQFGSWREVAVDDRLPTVRGRLLATAATGGDHYWDYWLPLLEKAYAKLYGSYESLLERGGGGGGVSRALRDLTGGVVQSFLLSGQDPRLTLQVLNSAVPRSTLPVATGGAREGRAYCVTGLARVRGAGDTPQARARGAGETPLVRVRDPSGRDEWSGAWTPGSRQWRALSDRDRDLLGARVTRRGEFWMSFEEFLSRMTRLELVHVGPDDWLCEPALHAKRPWRAVLARRRWLSGYNAGGGPHCHETTAMNPQFHLQIPRTTCAVATCHVVVSVTQRLRPALAAIGFAVYEVPPHAPRLQMGARDPLPLDVTHHSAALEVVTFFTLPPGDYLVVPQTRSPDVDAEFLLRILTDERTDVWEVNEDNVLIRNISDEFMDPERPHAIPAEVHTTLAKLSRKRSLVEVDAVGLRRVLGRRLRSVSAELCRSLVMLRDTDLTGRILARDVLPLLLALHHWDRTFTESAGRRAGRCGSRAAGVSSYRLRPLLRAAGVTVSNKVLESLVLRFAPDAVLTAESYVTAMVRLHLAHARYRSLDTKPESNPLSLEEMILMTIYS